VVVISDNANQTREICKEAGIPEISYRLRKQWISQQLQDMDHISVRVLDETDIPVYPAGWDLWSKRMREVVPEKIDAFFVGDMEYGDTLATYFPEATVELFDPARTRYPISATDIRSNILGNWHYILGAARPANANRRRRKVCIFCEENISYIDYKDASRLRKFISERGKILPRRVSGTCAKHQRELQTAIKRARHAALLPFVDD
jgi:small subunit ribosomal protein S18